MGSPEKPVDVEMGDMSESAQLNPEKTSEEQPDKATRFTGLTKEELLEISGQPGWVRARWLLFILFWLVWVGMLVGAIVIVIQAPRCKPDPELQWYQKEIGYVVDETFGDVAEHVDYLKALGTKSVIMKGMSESELEDMIVSIAGEKQNQDFKFIAEVAATADSESTAAKVDSWLAAGADGVMATGFEAFSSADAIALAQKLWEKVNATDTESEWSARALYLTSTDDGVAQALYADNNMTTVLLSKPFDDCVGQGNAGKCFRDALDPYRTADRNVVGYMLSDDFNKPDYQAGLNTLMLALPGVTITRSADEFLGDQTANFTWVDDKSGDSVPARSLEEGNDAALNQYKKLSPKKAPGIEQEKSLIFDEAGGAKFDFITESDDGLAFCRQWDTKPTMLVVSNMTPDDVTVDATGCLIEGDEDNVKNLEEGQIADASFVVGENDGTVKLDAVKLASGQTVIIKA